MEPFCIFCPAIFESQTKRANSAKWKNTLAVQMGVAFISSHIKRSTCYCMVAFHSTYIKSCWNMCTHFDVMGKSGSLSHRFTWKIWDQKSLDALIKNKTWLDPKLSDYRFQTINTNHNRNSYISILRKKKMDSKYCII